MADKQVKRLDVLLTTGELVLINNALNEVLNGPAAIGTQEFQTRTGATVSEAEALLSRLARLIDDECRP